MGTPAAKAGGNRGSAKDLGMQGFLSFSLSPFLPSSLLPSLPSFLLFIDFTERGRERKGNID